MTGKDDEPAFAKLNKHDRKNSNLSLTYLQNNKRLKNLFHMNE